MKFLSRNVWSRKMYLSGNIWPRKIEHDGVEYDLFHVLTHCLNKLCTLKECTWDYYYQGTLVAEIDNWGMYFENGSYQGWFMIQIKKSFLSENKKRLRSELASILAEAQCTRFELKGESLESLFEGLLR